MAEWPVNAAISAVKRGLSANESLRQMRAAGSGIRRQDWLALMREVRGQLEANATGINRPGNRRPLSSEILVMTTVVETGFLQHIDIWVKSHETGEISIRPFTIKTDELLTHDDAIETALDQFGKHADHYGETILGGTYLSTYVMVKRGES